MSRVTAIVCGLAILAPACGVHTDAPRTPAAPPTQVYTFPLTLPNTTEVCVVAYRPQLSVGCVTLGRLRRIAFDLEAD